MVNEANEFLDQPKMQKEEKFRQWRQGNGSMHSKGPSFKRRNSDRSAGSIIKHDFHLRHYNDATSGGSFMSDTVPNVEYGHSD